MLVDTSGCGLTEHSHHSSYGNMGESDILAFIVNELLHSGLSQENVAVITPYKRQVDIIKNSLDALAIVRVEVQTVDGFQGREKEAVILSLVRSNPSQEVGFLADKRRMNVAVSRARRFLCVVTDAETVKSDPTCASLVKHIRRFGNVRSGFEYSYELRSATLAPVDKTTVSPVFEAAEEVPPADIPSVEVTSALPLPMPTPLLEEQMTAKTSQSEKKRRNTSTPTSDLTVGFHEMILSKDRSFLIEVDSTLQAFDQLKTLDKGEDDISDSKAKVNDSLAPFVRILSKFKESDESEFMLRLQFDSYQRMCIHMAAEHLGLVHYSIGEGDDRRVLIKKQQPPIPNQAAEVDAVVNSEIAQLETTKSKKKKSRGRGFQELACVDNPDMPPEGAGLVRDALPELGDVEDTAATVPRSRRSRRGKKKIVKEPEEKVDPTDELLDELVKQSNVCSFPGCKESVKLIGDNCSLCRHRFCISHMLPEVHGCGEKAKEAARKAYVKPSPKPLTKEQKKALKKSLDRKLTEKSLVRKGVPKL